VEEDLVEYRHITRREFIEKVGWGAAMLAGGTGLLEACGTNNSGPASATPKKGGHIVWGVGTDIITLNPLIGVDTNTRTMGNMLFDPLVYFDDNSNPVPMIAEAAPKVSSDGMTYTFPIRKGIKWSDGQPLTVDDIVWTYSLLYDPKYAAFNFANRGIAVANLQSVTAPDANTIVMKTKQVFAPFLIGFGNWPILPKHVLGNMSATELNTAAFNKAPSVTSGPFKFVRWDEGSQVVLARNDDYYRGAPLLDQMVLRVISPTSLPSAFPTGEVDIGLVAASDLSRSEAGGNVNTQNVNGALYYYVTFNLDPAKHGSQLFSDQSVRQALMYGINRQAVGDAVFFKTETIVDSPIPNISWAYQKLKMQYGYDRARAEQMLDAAGWKLNSSTGIRERNSVPLQFEVVVNNSPQARTTLVQAIAAQWKDIGVAASPKVVAGAEWLQQITTKRDFDALLLLFVWGGSDPDQTAAFSSASAKPGGFNCMSYKNPQVDTLLEQAVRTLDRNTRKQLYTQFAQIVMQELPLLPILSTGNLWPVNKRIQDLKLGPFTEFINWQWIKDVWVSDGK
jgi:peptide/nickel transport system substrate-binding protein